MSQKFSLYDDLTVEENIHFFSGIYGVANSRKKERLEWVARNGRTSGQKKAITRTLPGGFKQRLALGCAILHEPQIIFLDEPTSGVDPISRRNFWNLINEMSKAGITIFVTTHYMDEADYCNRLALIYRGRIIAEGTPNELKQKYMTRYVLEVEVDRVVEAMEVMSIKARLKQPSSEACSMPQSITWKRRSRRSGKSLKMRISGQTGSKGSCRPWKMSL